MIATMNGMVTQLHLAADKPGEFYGQSAQYSGGGFSGMNFTVRALPPDAFAQWVAGARQTGSALDRASYLELCQPSSKVRPFTYRTADATLFNAVVTQQIPPCPGANSVRTGAAVHPQRGH
jgi:cytochrome o ubiquinol oxidase subunit II